CGPEAILRAAGGQFTNILGEQLYYGLTQLKNTHGLVATNGAYHQKVIEALEPVAKELGLSPQVV
ncbi:MAG: 3'(2'),5'-bisphosphate nucleotidase CysQ, partial [Nitrospirales bacterium]